MALSVSSEGTPIKVTGTTAAKQLIIDRRVFIKFVYWFNPSSSGDLFALKNNKGQDIVSGRCETDAQSQWIPVYTRYDNIYCDDLDSGTLFVYLG